MNCIIDYNSTNSIISMSLISDKPNLAKHLAEVPSGFSMI